VILIAADLDHLIYQRGSSPPVISTVIQRP
jgi:hypothetical protein